jgi:PAS domain S-box-containing protein
MIPSVAAAPLHFSIEFACFVVAAGAVVLIPFRPNLVTGGGWARATAVLGFAALALAAVLHGASFIERDSSETLVALRTFGLVAVLLAIGAARVTPSAGAAVFAFDQPLLFAPAGAGLLLAVAAAIKTRHRGEGNLWRLAAAGVLFAAAEGLVAASRRAGHVGDITDSLAWSAHGLRLMSFVAVGLWLWAGVRASVRSRFVAAFAALLVIVVLALSTTLSVVISNNVEREELARVETQLDNALRIIQEDERAVSRFVRLIGDADTVRSAVSSGGRLDAIADNFAQSDTFPLDFVVFTNPRGGLLAYSGAGPAQRDGDEVRATSLERSDVASLLGSPVLMENVLEGGREIAVNVDRISNDAVAIVAAAEVLDPTQAGDRAGIVLAGRYLDAFTVEEVSAGLGPSEATLLLDDRVLASSLPDATAQRIEVPADVRTALSPAAGPIAQEQKISGSSYFSAFGAIESEAGQPTLVLSTPAEIVSDTRRDIIRSLFLVTLGVGLVAFLLAWLSGRRITRPIQQLTTAAGAVREGDLSTSAPVTGVDEVGRLGEVFNDMTAALRWTTEDLRQAAREEEALRGRIETIIQSMADGLVAVDAEKRILAFNMEAELLTGLKADEVIGRPIKEILVVHDARGEGASLPVYELREGASANVYVERKYGTPVPVAVTSAVLRDEHDRIAGAVAVMRDMSREHEIDKMKGEFLSNISHELRTPLTPIKGYSELLTRTDLPPGKAVAFARGILESTQRLERIVSLLVDYSSIEAGRMAPRTSSIEVAKLLEGLAEEWSDRSSRHRIVTDVAGTLPRITGDLQLLRRSIEEVLDNALKFSPDGGTITLEAHLTRDATRAGDDDARGVVEVTVSDEGIGISPEDVARIFSDFHQIDASETRSFGGLGLGLALVQRIVAAHQGEVRVDSEPERGTRLTIAVPVSRSAASGG